MYHILKIKEKLKIYKTCLILRLETAKIICGFSHRSDGLLKKKLILKVNFMWSVKILRWFLKLPIATLCVTKIQNVHE